MNKWLKIGGIVGIVVIVGAVTLVAAVFVLRGISGFASRLPFGPGGFGARPGAEFRYQPEFRGGPQNFRGGPFFGPGRFGGPMERNFRPGGPPGFGPGGFGFFRGDDGYYGPGFGRGAENEVTAVGDNSLTIQTRSGDSITVNVTDETRIMLAATRSEGSLSDIQVGYTVRVFGRKNDDGSIDARQIVALPGSDRVVGRVRAVDGATISVNGSDGQATIVTDADTRFRLGREAASLSDVRADKFIIAFGEKQADGSLSARLVIIGGPGAFGPRERWW